MDDHPTPAEPPDDPRAAMVAQAVAGTVFGPIEWVRETGSTNDDLLAAASAGARPGLVRATDHQTAGRGRRDRTWVTAPGDALLVSMLLAFDDPADAAATATTMVAVSAIGALHHFGFDAVRIKWPNDLVVGEPGDHHKLAGILAQAITVGDRLSVVIGMGLNLRSRRLDAPDAVALDQLVVPGGALPDAPELLIAVLGGVDGWMRARATADAASGGSALQAAWLANSATVGTQVVADLGDRSVSGLAVGTTAAGALVIRPDDGSAPVEIHAGDVVSVRPGPS